MADQAVQFSITFRDGLGTERATQAYLQFPETLTLNDLWLAFNQWYQSTSSLSDAHVSAGLIRVIPTLTPLSSPDQARSRVEQTGVLNFLATGSDKRWGMAIPGVSPNVMTGDRVDLSNSAVIHLLEIMTGAINSGTSVAFTNSHNQPITAFVDALVSFRKKRKQLQRSSFEV